jgi:hypothetical protein
VAGNSATISAAFLVERVTFHSVETGFCVLRVKARGHRDLATIVGHAATISAGEWITASGDWVNHARPCRLPMLRRFRAMLEDALGRVVICARL